LSDLALDPEAVVRSERRSRLWNVSWLTDLEAVLPAEKLSVLSACPTDSLLSEKRDWRRWLNTANLLVLRRTRKVGCPLAYLSTVKGAPFMLFASFENVWLTRLHRTSS
jgi:hypothetical protein